MRAGALLWRLVRLDVVGVVFGALFFCLSLTPSLLPRNWLFQGLIAGINAAFGYGAGVLVGVALGAGIRRWFARGGRYRPKRSVAFVLKAGVGILSPAACLLMLVPAARWQRQVSALLGIEGPQTSSYLRTLLISAGVAAAIILAARLLIGTIRLLTRLATHRWPLHDEVALFLSTGAVVTLLVTLINGVLVRGFFAGADAVFEPKDTTTPPGVIRPAAPQRSGSPASLVGWETLGRQGRRFVSGGLNATELTAINRRAAREPIRVFAGLGSSPDDAGRIRLLVDELERTRAFDRRVLAVVPTTGTGWINPVAARALEILYNGDTAIVGVQYSFLPSWISFLADRERSRDSGRLLIDTVVGRWRQKPAHSRPKLVLYGESLGSMAGQAAFGYLPDIEESGLDGVLWVGPPNSSFLWSALVARRDPGCKEVLPCYDNGRTVRFAQGTEPGEVARVAAAPWEGTRVLFLQHASDPVVWWSPQLLFSRPDWLTEAPGVDRTSSMRWYPVVTFWQVAADVGNGERMPAGHGHNYENIVLDGWVAVAAPDGWTAGDTERIRPAVQRARAGD